MRAQEFLTTHARVAPLEPGLGDDECRAAMRSVFGYSDEGILTTFWRIRHRYSGLTYFSIFRQAEILFEPTFEVDLDTGQVVFAYAVMDAAPDGCRSGSVRPDETVWFGFLDRDAPTFPSLDHFLECDALLHHAHQQRLLSTETPPCQRLPYRPTCPSSTPTADEPGERILGGVVEPMMRGSCASTDSKRDWRPTDMA
ncbi:hypothetical protein [Dactylosporangium sp. NPDC005555]|uniref:hypothetical protein n=1 Tax=Dactylosporangium sp. NPDC005555 TaxID=3154889 RepID=UPI0033B1DA26